MVRIGAPGCVGVVVALAGLLGSASARGGAAVGDCDVSHLTSWVSQGRTYVLAEPGASGCDDLGPGCAAEQILEFTACDIAMHSCLDEASMLYKDTYCADNGNIEDHYDDGTHQTIEECSALCNSQPNCQFFLFGEDDRTGVNRCTTQERCEDRRPYGFGGHTAIHARGQTQSKAERCPSILNECGEMEGPETWGGPRGCHVQFWEAVTHSPCPRRPCQRPEPSLTQYVKCLCDVVQHEAGSYTNGQGEVINYPAGPGGCGFQFNENGDEGQMEDHAPLCLLGGSDRLDAAAVQAGTSFPCCSDCMDGCGGWPASDECHNEEHTSYNTWQGQPMGICDCDDHCGSWSSDEDGLWREGIPGYKGDGVQQCIRECSDDAILSSDARCPRGYSFPESAEACAAAAAVVGHPLSAGIQETCDRDPCTSADVEPGAQCNPQAEDCSGWDGLPICSLMAAEGYRAMYVAPPQGSYEGRAGEYFQAVCVKGGDVLEDEGCFCAGVATPMLGGGNVCEMKDGAAWCWTAPGTCADGTNAGDLGIPGFDYDASLMACAEENSRNEDCDPTAVYPILIPCMTALASPSTFCESDCHLILRPWVDQCMNGMDAGVQTMMEPAIQMLDACPPPPPGQGGGSGGEVDAPCCQGCQDGCGGYKSRSGDYGEDAIAPECLNPDHTRVVRGVTMGICDSDGQTDYDGQPCSRDCEDRCPDPGKALESCDLDPPPEDASLHEFCQNDCVQGAILCVDSPILAERVVEIRGYEDVCTDLYDDGNDMGGAGDAYCNTAVMATACAQAEAQYGENPALWPAAAAPLGFCDIPCVQELMDCHDDPRIANTGLGAEDIATVAALCGSVDPCADITEQMLPTMNTVCCSEPGACNEDGVPQTCSQDCADIYVPFWEECSHFMGQNADLAAISAMCTAAHPDVASSGRCTIAESPSRKCHGRCSQEGGHDREACMAVKGGCCRWEGGGGGGH